MTVLAYHRVFFRSLYFADIFAQGVGILASR